MLSSHRRLMLGFIAMPVLLASEVPAVAGTTLIDDAPLTPAETLVTVPLVGYRAFPKDALVALDPQQKHWVLKTSVLYDAAAQDSGLLAHAGFDAKGVRKLPVGEVLAMYQQEPLKTSPACDIGFLTVVKTNPSWEQQHSASALSSCPWTPPPIPLTTGPGLQGKLFDQDIVQLALAKGAFERSNAADPNSVRIEAIPGSDSYGVVVKPGFAKDVTNLYTALDKVSQTGVTGSDAFYFGKTSQIAWREPKVPEVTAIRLTEVGIGKVHIFPAKEMDLKVQPSILKKHDVYWVQLVINPIIDLRQSLDDLSFFVALRTTDAETLDLVPTKWGVEEEKASKVGIDGVEVNGVKVGATFEHDVAYKAIRPTIVGSGLADSDFHWTLSDESLDGSAKRLIAIVEVPKKTQKLSLAMIIVAHTKSYWLVQANTATTEQTSVDLPLPFQ